MALPPQIAVPVEMRKAGRGGTDDQLAEKCSHDQGEGDAHCRV